MDVAKILFSGVLGTFVMVLFMGLIQGFGLANANLIRALGSLITRSYQNSFLPGLFLHGIFGCSFAFFYALLYSLAPIKTPFQTLLLTTAMGTFHGLVASALITISVAEYHPLEEFRTKGFAVIVTYFLGHILYGFFVGLGFLITGLKY